MSKPKTKLSRECSLFRSSGAPMGTATLTRFTSTKQITKRDMRFSWNKAFAASNAALDNLLTERTLTISGKKCDLPPIEEAFLAPEVIHVQVIGFDFKCMITSLNSLSNNESYEADLLIGGHPTPVKTTS